MKRSTVLLADGHDVLIDGLVYALRRDFEFVAVARDGRTMIEMAKEKRPHVIVSDISMPNLSGIDAARMLRQDIPSIKILFLTMHRTSPSWRHSGLVLQDLCTKTCDLSELVKAIHSIANGSS